MEPGVVHLKRGKERKVRNFYPWIQKGECRAEGVPDGSLAKLVDADGTFLAIGTYNSKSRFQFRILSLIEETVDEQFFEARFAACRRLRETLLQGTTGWRLVHSEADQVPGLIVDQYGEDLVVQVRSLGMELLKPLWLPALIQATNAQSVYEKSEMAGRQEEGLPSSSGSLFGTAPTALTTTEDGLNISIPIELGLKTGYYFDQRETRRQFESRIRPGDKVLDCFCYTGSFTLRAARAGALAYGIDIHKPAIESARDAATSNNLEAVFIEDNAFEYMATDSIGPYDWIILDPPAIAKTADKRDSLKWAVWKLVHLALPLLKPGGRLIVCSCSYQLDLRELVETCRLAASDRHTRLFLENVTFQDVDHPAPIHFPESLYLKCAWLRKG